MALFNIKGGLTFCLQTRAMFLKGYFIINAFKSLFLQVIFSVKATAKPTHGAFRGSGLSFTKTEAMSRRIFLDSTVGFLRRLQKAQAAQWPVACLPGLKSKAACLDCVVSLDSQGRTKRATAMAETNAATAEDS